MWGKKTLRAHFSCQNAGIWCLRVLGTVMEVWKAGIRTAWGYSPSAEAAGGQGSWAGVWAWHRSFCLGNWLNVTILPFLCDDKVTMTGFSAKLQMDLWFTDICQEPQLHFATVLLWEFVRKIILGNLVLDTRR